MEKEIVNQVQEVQIVPYRLNPRRNMPRHILIKLTKTEHKERILKAAREKQEVTYKGNPICLTDDFSAEALQTRREWQDIFKVLKRKNLQLRLLYLGRISFKIDGEIKLFRYSNLGCRFFPFNTLNVSCHSLLACTVSLKDQLLSVWGFPCVLLVASPLVLLIFFLCVQSLLL